MRFQRSPLRTKGRSISTCESEPRGAKDIRYPNAIEDGRTSLKYKMELYPEESEIISEAHYKLSLALEFASITTPKDDGSTAKREAIDQDLRDEAIKEMELAIKSFKLKLQNKEVEVATMLSPEDNDLARKSINEMKELIADMEQRVSSTGSETASLFTY